MQPSEQLTEMTAPQCCDAIGVAFHKRIRYRPKLIADSFRVNTAAIQGNAQRGTREKPGQEVLQPKVAREFSKSLMMAFHFMDQPSVIASGEARRWRLTRLPRSDRHPRLTLEVAKLSACTMVRRRGGVNTPSTERAQNSV